MRTIPWQPGFTWRKLGFLSYSNSLNYREVLESTPEWNIITEPPIGAVINYDAPVPASGLLGTNITFTPDSTQTSLNFYPFNSSKSYIESLAKYTPSTLLSVDRINGWSADSTQATTGVQ